MADLKQSLQIAIKATGGPAAAAAFSQVAKTVEGLGKTTEQAGKSILGLSPKALALGGAGAALAIGAGTVKMLSDAARAAAQEQVELARLGAAVRNTGADWDVASGAISRYIGEQQRRVALDDGEARDSLASLTAITGDYTRAMDLLPLAMDVAQAKQISLASAAELVGRVARGNISMLTRYGIVLKEGATAAEALAQLQTMYGGQAEAYAATLEGQQRMAEIAIGNLQQTVGGAMLPALTRVNKAIVDALYGPAVQGAINDLAHQLDELAKRLLSLVPGTDDYAERITRRVEALAALDRGANMRDVAIQFELNTQEVQQLTWALAKGLGPAILDMVDATAMANLSQDQFDQVLQSVRLRSTETAEALLVQRRALLHTRNEQEAMVATMDRLMSGMHGFSSGIYQATEAQQAANTAWNSAITMLQGLRTQLQRAGVDADALGAALAGIGAMVTSLPDEDSLGLADALGRYRRNLIRAEDVSKGVTTPQRDWFEEGVAGDIALLDALGTAAVSTANRHWAEQERGAKGAGKAIGDVEAQFKSYLKTFEGAVQGIMTPTMPFDMTAWQDEMGAHVETWDEYARRAQDVVQLGGASPWADVLGFGGLDDQAMRAAAAQSIDDFYSGLMSDQINWEAIANKLKRQVQSKLAWQDILAMAPAELAKYGVSAADADVMKAFGFDMAASGMEAGDDYAASMIATLQDSGAALKTTGKGLGDAILAGVVSAPSAASSAFVMEVAKVVAPSVAPLVAAILKSRQATSGGQD